MFKWTVLRKLKKEGLSKIQAQSQYYLYKSHFIADILAESIISNIAKEVSLGITGIILCIIACIVGCKNEILGVLIDGIAIIVLIIFLILFFKTIRMYKKITDEEMEEKVRRKDEIIVKIRNIWLLNERVISKKMWKKIKDISQNSYESLRSGELTGQCYQTTLYMLNMLNCKDLKLLWVLNTDSHNMHKFGHAIIKKDDYIYCPNERRTYKLEKYLKAYNSKVYAELSIDKYKSIKHPNEIKDQMNKYDEWIPNKYIIDNFDEFLEFTYQNGAKKT